MVTLLVKAGFYATILALLTSILHGSNGISLGKVGYILSIIAHLMPPLTHFGLLLRQGWQALATFYALVAVFV